MNAKKAKQLRRLAGTIASKTLPAAAKTLTHADATKAAYAGLKRAARRAR